MDPIDYYTTTLIRAFKNLAPLLTFILLGYFIFIKLPFLFLKKSLGDQKRKLEDDAEKQKNQERYTLEHYNDFKKRLRVMNTSQTEEKRESSSKKEEKRNERKDNRPKFKTKSPEEVFEIRPGQILSEKELKHRYFELLKQNHPDRVATMGEEFKSLAERNTKEINEAYEALKRKAS